MSPIFHVIIFGQKWFSFVFYIITKFYKMWTYYLTLLNKTRGWLFSFSSYEILLELEVDHSLFSHLQWLWPSERTKNVITGVDLDKCPVFCMYDPPLFSNLSNLTETKSGSVFYLLNIGSTLDSWDWVLDGWKPYLWSNIHRKFDV